MHTIDLTSLNSELRGISDVQDRPYDHLAKIADLIAASKGHQDFWKFMKQMQDWSDIILGSALCILTFPMWRTSFPLMLPN